MGVGVISLSIKYPIIGGGGGNFTINKVPNNRGDNFAINKVPNERKGGAGVIAILHEQLIYFCKVQYHYCNNSNLAVLWSVREEAL